MTPDPGTHASADVLRFQVAERLAAHRKRRGRAQAQMPVSRTRSQVLFNSASNSSSNSNSTDKRTARIAAVVAERYSGSQSYCAYLAAEAERAVQQAQAAAEVAALNAQAMLSAQQTLLDALSQDGFDAAAANAEGDGAQSNANGDDGQNRSPARDPDRAIANPDAQLQGCLPEELRLWPEADASRSRGSNSRKTVSSRVRSAASATASSVASSEAPQAMPSGHATGGGLRVRLYDETEGIGLSNAAHETGSHGTGTNGSATFSPARRASPSGYQREESSDAEAMALDAEIAFRQSPIFEEPAGPAMPLPANLIEFPRQLVASRKVRPRLAEGPLRDEAEDGPARGQLRIFEVDPAQIDTTPPATSATLAAAMPQWTSIWLDAPGQAHVEGEIAGGQPSHNKEHEDAAIPRRLSLNLPHAASIRRRVAAAAIDGGIILSGFIASAAAFVLTSCRWVLRQPNGSLLAALGHGLRMIVGQAASQPGEFLVAGALTFVFLHLLYQGLFFSFSAATPGMRSARIALCTFSEENPSLSALRWRILVLMLSACPLGPGLSLGRAG